MTEPTRHKETQNYGQLARKMRVWAVIILALAVASSLFLPNTTLLFGAQAQESWQFLRVIGWVTTQFGLPLSAGLFVGSIIVARLPAPTCTSQ
ncbi:hypothetical protein QBL02_10065 [Leucobacter sp. UT-8R-CII-1-4]|uniref:hypothetical protein n=1 Tax=Leucobacter sp. UT-8R-CII-1-4 TaxID=3040075 RepID=UPI0024A9F426|nr:hypothetical protein [Leucobacter sp. UT-8R-CII-1-4]MDI6023888.1 hypothetical protein [Leucobacter sp. UT-8R-CII-1-4]